MVTAPTMAVPNCPRRPPHVMPSCSKSQPPTKPPKSPNTRFMMNPKPPPFINLPAQKPARHPIMIEPISPITFLLFSLLLLCSLCDSKDSANIVKHKIIWDFFRKKVDRYLARVIQSRPARYLRRWAGRQAPTSAGRLPQCQHQSSSLPEQSPLSADTVLRPI